MWVRFPPRANRCFNVLCEQLGVPTADVRFPLVLPRCYRVAVPTGAGPVHTLPAVTTLSRDPFIARLVARHPVRVWGDGSVWVELRDAGLADERVPVVYFAELRAKGLIEEVGPGEW
jgi:hypothetical protein